MKRLLLAAMMLPTSAFAGDPPRPPAPIPAPATIWEGLALTEKDLPSVLLRNMSVGRAPAKQDGTYNLEQRLYALSNPSAATANPSGAPLSVRPTNLYLRTSTTGMTKIVAIDADGTVRDIKPFAAGALPSKPYAALFPAYAASPVKVEGEPMILAAAKPAAAPSAAAGAVKLGDYEKALSAPGGVVKTELDKAACKDAAKCRERLIHLLGLLKQDTTAVKDKPGVGEKDYLMIRLREDYSYFESARNAAKEPAQAEAFVAHWRAAIAGEIKGYLDAPNKEAYNPDMTATSVTALVEKLKKALPARTPLGDDLSKIFSDDPSKSRNENEIAVMQVYFANNEQAKAKIKALAQASTPQTPKLNELLAMRKEAAAKAREFLGKQPRDTSSPFAAQPNDNLLLDFYCTPDGHAMAGGAPTLEQATAKWRSWQDAQTALATGGTSVDGRPVVSAGPGDTADLRCRDHHKKGSRPLTTHTTGGTPAATVQNNVAQPIGANAGQATDDKEDKTSKLNLYNGIKSAIVGAIIGGILGGPIGLLLGAAVLGGAGWYMSKDANEK